MKNNLDISKHLDLKKMVGGSFKKYVSKYHLLSKMKINS